MQYRSIIWDWNGTLLDDVDVCLELANEILDEHGLPMLDVERYREIFDFPVIRYWERAGLDLAKVDFEALSKRFCSRFDSLVHEIPLFDGARRVLEDLEEAGARQFILSNTEQNALLRMLESKQVSHLFAGVQGLDDTLARGKAGAGADLLANHGLDRDETVMIGDTLHDLEVAESLGIACVLVSTGHHTHDRLAETGTPVIASLEEIHQIF
ncbi:MAG: HAD family hydrolase [Pseudomonadales bacterium]|nr:HAD family hydrolase [Pseudomonadales bacterium]